MAPRSSARDVSWGGSPDCFGAPDFGAGGGGHAVVDAVVSPSTSRTNTSCPGDVSSGMLVVSLEAIVVGNNGASSSAGGFTIAPALGGLGRRSQEGHDPLILARMCSREARLSGHQLSASSCKSASTSDVLAGRTTNGSSRYGTAASTAAAQRRRCSFRLAANSSEDMRKPVHQRPPQDHLLHKGSYYRGSLLLGGVAASLSVNK